MPGKARSAPRGKYLNTDEQRMFAPSAGRTCNSVEFIPSISTIYFSIPESIRSDTRIARPPKCGRNILRMSVMLSGLRADCKVKTVNPPTNSGPTQPPKLLDQVAGKMRLLHYSKRTEVGVCRLDQAVHIVSQQTPSTRYGRSRD